MTCAGLAGPAIVLLALGVAATVIAGLLQLRMVLEADDRLSELERLVGVRYRPPQGPSGVDGQRRGR